MMRIGRYLIVLTAITALALLIAACAQNEKKTESETPMAIAGTGTGGALSWDIPAGWKTAPEKPMRLSTYIIDPSSGDTDSAECAVFYFGPTQGGSVEDNLRRWASQFEQPDGSNSMDKAETENFTRDDLKITSIDLSGTYKVSGGPMMQVSDKKENYHLLGAIVEGPQGSVFFKMTGPVGTVEGARASFKAMIDSIKPGMA